MSTLPQGEYIIRISALDRSSNESVVSRKILFAMDDTASEVALFNPMPGETHSGPLNVSGLVSGAVIPKQITLMINDRSESFLDVDRYGVFRFAVPEERLASDQEMLVSATYVTPAGEQVTSPQHLVYYSPFGPSLVVESHADGDMITSRPYLSGRAWIAIPPPEGGMPGPTRKELAALAVEQVLISFDNGRTFEKAQGAEKWKFRLETGDLPLGPLPILIRAEFVNGEEAVRRILLTVDTNAPSLDTLAPAEDSTHRDQILVYGTAGDDYELDSVEVSLRPGDKAGYSVPQFIQGLYLDGNVFGATYADIGLGMSFFKDNVKIQIQGGIAPVGRFTGNVFGMKIIANVFYLPFDYFFGPDWAWYSMSIALGANFSYFTMDPDANRDPLYMGAVLAQWEFIKADLSYFFPKWKYFKNISFYLEPIFWFASSDVQAEAIFRATIGARINIF
jgi:hypothetical protein